MLQCDTISVVFLVGEHVPSLVRLLILTNSSLLAVLGVRELHARLAMLTTKNG